MVDIFVSLLKKIVQRWHYKLSALVLACLVWYYVQGERVLEVNQKIMVQLLPAPGYLIKGEKVRVKDATLSGTRSLLSAYMNNPLEASIYIPKKTGNLRFRLDKSNINNWNSRIKLIVHDAYVKVYVDEELKKSLPVEVHAQGVPAEGYLVERTTVQPGKVEVIGMKSELSRLSTLMTEAVDLSGIQKSQSFQVKISTHGLNPVKLSQDLAKVSVQVGEKRVNKTYKYIPIEMEGAKYVTRLRPNYTSIVIQGTPGVLKFIKKADLRAFLDVRDLLPGRHEKKIQVKIPEDTTFIETLPKNAAVEVSEKVMVK